MKDALLGFSGFVGSTLLRQRTFDGLFRSSNIEDVNQQDYDLVVCAAAPAKKWLANKEPEKDKAGIDRLCTALASMKCKRFVLISTVDVFRDAQGVDEDTNIEEEALAPYGLHRRQLERFVESSFPSHHIIRLSGLVGPGLTKNAIFDFAHNNNVDQIDSRHIMQFYPMVNLWTDLKAILASGERIVHLAGPPVSLQTVAEEGFGLKFVNELDRPVARYDMKTKHARMLGGPPGYACSEREALLAIRSYAQAERVNSNS